MRAVKDNQNTRRIMAAAEDYMRSQRDINGTALNMTLLEQYVSERAHVTMEAVQARRWMILELRKQLLFEKEELWNSRYRRT